MNRLLLILATISVVAVVLMFAPSADAHGGFGNQVFIQSSPFGFHQQAVVVQSAPRVFVGQSFGSRVFVQSGHAFSNRVFVQQPQVQVNVNRGFGLFRRNNVRVFVR